MALNVKTVPTLEPGKVVVAVLVLMLILVVVLVVVALAGPTNTSVKLAGVKLLP